ncbi:hypothetical protein C4587_00840 [Candidatus Parcubacteria bacterium]|nr:MAG: hypothetical protein C4587_00840 [Candidatus Parcubacteria bacterium]
MAQSHKLTKGQREALKKIAKGDGYFHRNTGARLEDARLAVPQSFSSSIWRNAARWRLTAFGAAALAQESEATP